MQLLCQVIALFSLELGQSPAERDKALSNLQGTWSIVSVEHRGKKPLDRFDRDMKLTIRGNKWSWARGRSVDEATIAVDTSKHPWRIDLEYQPTGTSSKPVRCKGIYQIDGDKLTWCHAGSGTERPESFDKSEEGKYVLVWKRVRD
jgi:uncharacterized protein (TIGR03067 family)